MTTDAGLGLALAAVVGCYACGHVHETRTGDSVDVSSYPPEIQQAYEVFARRCSRCHTLARPLNARITDPQHWVRYVTRMRRQPGSGINRRNADTILRFLHFYTAEVRDAEQGEPALDAPYAPAPDSDSAPEAQDAPAPEGAAPGPEAGIEPPPPPEPEDNPQTVAPESHETFGHD